jgi:hypothetical protein
VCEVELWCGLCRFVPCPTIKHIHSMTALKVSLEGVAVGKCEQGEGVEGQRLQTKPLWLGPGSAMPMVVVVCLAQTVA